DRVTVTINNSASAGYAYQLVSGSTAYSGYFLGTGGILVIESFPISANLTLTIQASRIAAPICTQNVGSIPVTVRSLPTTANAGPDQQGCTGNFTLAANNAAVGTGQWSVVGIDPGVTIADLSSPTSSVSGLPAGSSVTLRWTISNNPCPASFDDVTITRHPAPTPANAGPDIVQCNNGTFTMAGNQPLSGNGFWTRVSGPSVAIANPNAYNTTVSGLPPGQSATLRWSISVGG